MPPRLVRWQDRGHTHFLTFSCYNRNAYLLPDSAKEIFLTQLELLRKRHVFHVFGYVLMPEHVHLLVSEPKQHNLANTLRALKTQTSKLLREDRPQFWHRRYHDFNVITNEKHTEKLRYLHRNPVHRGLAANPEDYPWSSFRNYAFGHSLPVEIESEWTAARGQRDQPHS